MTEGAKAERAVAGTWITDYVADFLTAGEQDQLLEVVRSLPYMARSSRGSELRRRQCEFGATYAPTGVIGPAPTVVPELIDVVRRVNSHCDRVFDQMIVTWYPGGAGIGHHCDHTKWFGDTIAAVSLGTACKLRGMHPERGKVDQLIAPGSLYVLRHDERYVWEHEIVNGRRADRWSLTLRSLTREAHQCLAALR